jgi:hypothetical protein
VKAAHKRTSAVRPLSRAHASQKPADDLRGKVASRSRLAGTTRSAQVRAGCAVIWEGIVEIDVTAHWLRDQAEQLEILVTKCIIEERSEA